MNFKKKHTLENMFFETAKKFEVALMRMRAVPTATKNVNYYSSNFFWVKKIIIFWQILQNNLTIKKTKNCFVFVLSNKELKKCTVLIIAFMYSLSTKYHILYNYTYSYIQQNIIHK